MARLPGLCPVGIPQHIVQRGNNRQVCFNGDEDMAAYVGWLKEFSAKFQVEIHAWVFMNNHVHLLVTPRVDYRQMFFLRAVFPTLFYFMSISLLLLSCTKVFQACINVPHLVRIQTIPIQCDGERSSCFVASVE